MPIVPLSQRRFSEACTPRERQRIPRTLRAWGYPRTLVPGELQGSFWFRYGWDVIGWLNQTEGRAREDDWLFHIAIRPEQRGRLNGRRFFTGMDILAELIGARRLVAALKSPRDDHLRAMLGRLGWNPGPGGSMIRALGKEGG